MLLHAILEIEAYASAPRGALKPAAGPPYRFAGWLELASAMEEWRAAAPPRVAAEDAVGIDGTRAGEQPTRSPPASEPPERSHQGGD
jgi:hypothetical protein